MIQTLLNQWKRITQMKLETMFWYCANIENSLSPIAQYLCAPGFSTYRNLNTQNFKHFSIHQSIQQSIQIYSTCSTKYFYLFLLNNVLCQFTNYVSSYTCMNNVLKALFLKTTIQHSKTIVLIKILSKYHWTKCLFKIYVPTQFFKSRGYTFSENQLL